MNPKTREEKRALLAKYKAATDFPLKVSGLILEMVPPPMAAWIIANEVPESLFGAAVSAVNGGPAATAEALKMPEMFDLAIKIVYGSCRWPKLTPKEQRVGTINGEPWTAINPQGANTDGYADDPELLDPYTLPIPDLSDILAWGVSGTKNATVQLDSGEVTGGELMSFRSNGSVPGDSESGGQIQAQSGA